MIQLIGFLLCVYLVVKGFELLAMHDRWAKFGAVISFLAAPLFFALFVIQGDAVPGAFGGNGSSPFETGMAVDPTLETFNTEAANLEAEAANWEATADSLEKGN